MGKLIYLDNYRPQEPDLPPYSACGGLIVPYVVDPSVPPKTPAVIVRASRLTHSGDYPCLTILLREDEESLKRDGDLPPESGQIPYF